jgi:sec-independent protein translocase protein TatB
MFGVGAQEMVIIGLIFLVAFGPSKLPRIARDLGRFVREAHHQLDQFKSEVVSVEEEDQKNRRHRS